MQDKKNNLDIEKADKEIITYLELLLEKKGMDKLPSEILADMLMDLYPRFQNFLFLSVMQKMPAEKMDKFESFLESSPTPEESRKFMEENTEN